MNDIRVLQGNPYPLGSYVTSKNAVNFAMVCNTDAKCGIILYNKVIKATRKIPFGEKNRVGNIYCLRIENINIEDYEYQYYVGDEMLCDPYGKIIYGNEHWGRIPKRLRAGFVSEEKSDDSDIVDGPMLDYSESVIYTLHVRGFTRHKSSNVAYPGTFSGIVEKIPYLKELGVTTIELMPAYEFIELEEPEITSGDVMDAYKPIEPKLNYWGYKDGYYFAPKSSYTEPGVSPHEAFRNLVNVLHTNGMEIIMQFYFPRTVKQAYIPEVLKFWVNMYHVDGFHLMGEQIPLALLGTEPMFANTKLIYYNFPIDEIYGSEKPKFKNLATCNDEYMYNFRRFLKSDEGQICNVISGMKELPEKNGMIHYMTNCNGFTLMDLVSYDRKHNELNGEGDHDGNPYNASWNCGFEGKTNRKSVNRLRRRQIRNAIAFNMFSQSTPMILMGDEFGNSQKGNNNPYCIDGPVTWLNWNDLKTHSDIYDFMKKCIEIRKSYDILHMNRTFRMSDYLSNGYPDLSMHGEEAWKIETDDLTRHFGMMYSQEYAYYDINGKPLSGKTAGRKSKEYDLIYIGVNMHWSNHNFALPKLPQGKEWKVILDTYKDDNLGRERLSSEKNVLIKDRSIVVLLGK